MSTLHRTLRSGCGLLMLVLAPLASAAGGAPPQGPGTGVDNGVDPLFLRHRFEFEAGRTNLADVGLPDRTTSFTLRGAYAWKGVHLFGLDLPYYRPEERDGRKSSDFGDLSVTYLMRHGSGWGPFDAIGWGGDFVIPTGDLKRRTGGAQWSLVPRVVLGYYGPRGLGIFPALQLFKTLANDEHGAPDRTQLELSVRFTMSRPKWWAAVAPEAFLDIERDLTSFEVRIQGGRLFTKRWGLYAEAAASVGGSGERFDDQVLTGLRVLP